MSSDQENEITVKDLISTLRIYSREMWRRKIFIFLVTGLFASVTLLKAYLDPVLYCGEVTFMSSNRDNNIAGLTSILGQFGINGGKSGVNPYKVLEIAKSRTIIQRALFTEARIKDTLDLLGNHIIREYQFHEEWKSGNEELSGFFFENGDVYSFGAKENKVLNKLHKLVKGRDGLMVCSLDEVTGIMTLTIKTTSDELSAVLAEAIYKELEEYYDEKKKENKKQTFDVFKKKTDSIEQVLNSTQYQLYKFRDNNRGLTLQQYNLKETRLEQEIQKLIIAYSEAYRSQELADFSLRNQESTIQVIDLPLRPLPATVSSKLQALVIGTLLGLVFSIIFVVVQKIYRDVTA